eukprot:358395-Prymnesium_polylepis.1
MQAKHRLRLRVPAVTTFPPARGCGDARAKGAAARVAAAWSPLEREGRVAKSLRQHGGRRREREDAAADGEGHGAAAEEQQLRGSEGER